MLCCALNTIVQKFPGRRTSLRKADPVYFVRDQYKLRVPMPTTYRSRAEQVEVQNSARRIVILRLRRIGDDEQLVQIII